MSALRELREEQARQRRDRERLILLAAIQETGGNISRAALALGIARLALTDKINQLGLAGTLATIRKEARS